MSVGWHRRSDERAREQQTSRLELLQAEQDALDLRELMRLPVGRRFIARLLYRVCGVTKNTYRGNADGMFLEGSRRVGLIFLEELEAGDRELRGLFETLTAERLQRNADLAAMLEEQHHERTSESGA